MATVVPDPATYTDMNLKNSAVAESIAGGSTNQKRRFPEDSSDFRSWLKRPQYNADTPKGKRLVLAAGRLVEGSYEKDLNIMNSAVPESMAGRSTKQKRGLSEDSSDDHSWHKRPQYNADKTKVVPRKLVAGRPVEGRSRAMAQDGTGTIHKYTRERNKHWSQDYHMQLMLLDQQNKRRLMQARMDRDALAIDHTGDHPVKRSRVLAAQSSSESQSRHRKVHATISRDATGSSDEIEAARLHTVFGVCKRRTHSVFESAKQA